MITTGGSSGVPLGEAGGGAGGTAGSFGGANEGGSVARGGAAAGAGGEAPRICARNSENTDGPLELVTLSTDCAAADGDAAFSRLTPDGRYVVFDSDAHDLVPNDLNGISDGFLFDLEARTLELISKKYGGEGPANGLTFLLVPSDDARYIAFTSYTYELTATPPPGGIWVYLRDRQSGTTRRFTADYACTYWLDMSGDAAFLVAEGFTNCQGGLEAKDHDSAIEYDRVGGTQRHLGITNDGGDNYRPALTRDGRYTLWAIRPPATRGQMTSRLRLYDRVAQTTETLPMYGFHFGSTDISDSGNVIAFAQNQQVYLYDREQDQLTVASKNAAAVVGDGYSSQVSLSGDGRRLVFRSAAKNLVEGDTNGVPDIFLYDADTAAIERLSLAPDGTQADGDSQYPFISGDGSKVSFTSKARNLLPLATSGNFQLYLRTLEP